MTLLEFASKNPITAILILLILCLFVEGIARAALQRAEDRDE